MKLKIDKFCGLATSNDWQRWLYGAHRALYDDLINHLRTGDGCRANADKMKVILAKITESGGQDGLLDFLLEKHPEVVVSDPVFPHYDPDLLTIPRRKVFEAPRDQLESLRDEFLRDKHTKYEWVVTGGKGYLEFLPAGYAADRVPERSWLIPVHKRRKNIL